MAFIVDPLPIIHSAAPRQPFNFFGLREIYSAALKNNDPTIAFELGYGCGRFQFLMFFAEEDLESRDRLFILLRRTQILLRVKLYGSRRKGEFNAYFTDRDRLCMVDEIGLTRSGGKFDFDAFLAALNRAIPKKLDFREKAQILQCAAPKLEASGVSIVDDPEKIHLIGVIRVADGKNPRDATLRKLIIYQIGEPAVVLELIEILKRHRLTTAWTKDPARNRLSIGEAISEAFAKARE